MFKTRLKKFLFIFQRLGLFCWFHNNKRYDSFRIKLNLDQSQHIYKFNRMT